MAFRSLWTAQEPSGPVPGLVIDEDSLKSCLQLERYGVVAGGRGRWQDHAQFAEVHQQALDTIDARFAMVPEGFVSLASTAQYPGVSTEIDVETEPYLVARTTVTNAQYYKFVESGAYEDLDLWPEEIWPHLISFHDQTECPGPRFWHNGVYDGRCADHPVVGVCFYEAGAYAKWAGFRLPTEPEWQMAASWRIRSSAHGFRLYPWGQSFDKSRCNVWSTGRGETVSVDEYDAGAAPNGVLQLAGNVWEWTTSDFEITDGNGRPIVADMLMKSVRGGAFDTYFAAQATSNFRTGLVCLARSHNTGIRCALDVNFDS